MKWDAPPSDMITIEEATGEIKPCYDGNAVSPIIREHFKAYLKPELLCSLFGDGLIVNPELATSRARRNDRGETAMD